LLLRRFLIVAAYETAKLAVSFRHSLALCRLDGAHGDLAGATVFLGIERDLLTLNQPTHSGAFERGGVNENILAAVIRLNEAEAFLVVVELHGARSHQSILFADLDALQPKLRDRVP
jgi:hypothetical protein